MIKILYIINDFEDISLNHNAFKIANSLPRDKFTAYILTLRDNGSLKDDFFTTFRHNSFTFNKSFFHGVFLAADIIKKYGIQIVHTQTLRADYTLFFAKILLSLNRIRIFHAANRRNYLFLTCEPNFLVKNILYIISCHLADFNICVANHLQYKLINRLMVSKQKVITIFNGVKPRNIDSSQKHPSGVPLITFTGKLIKRKNVLCLLKALFRITLPYKCFIIGDGPEKSRLIKYVAEQKLEAKISFIPFTPNVEKFLSKTDIFVLPSLAEGMSMSLLEAMSFGLACIVSDIDANTELIKHTKNGLIFPKTQTKVLAAYLDLLLENTKLRQKLGMNAYRNIKDNYEIKKMLWRYQKFYTRVSVSDFNPADFCLTFSSPKY